MSLDLDEMIEEVSYGSKAARALHFDTTIFRLKSRVRIHISLKIYLWCR